MPSGDITIPSTIAGLPVTAIADGAFYYWRGQGLSSVTIGSNVTTIGAASFAYSSLANLTLGPDVTSIGPRAFGSCSRLASVTMANSLTNIGDYAFSYCSALSNLNFSSNLTAIGTSAFVLCTTLTNVNLPNGLTSVGDGAFSGCSGLTNLLLPETLTNIGDGAFSACASLGAISALPLNPAFTSVDGVLFNKKKTKLVQVPAAKGPSYAIPESVTTIGNAAFSGCSSLTNVTMPDSVTNIDGLGGCGGEIKAGREANRITLERLFMTTRDEFCTCDGWHCLTAAQRESIHNIFFRVWVTEENLAA